MQEFLINMTKIRNNIKRRAVSGKVLQSVCGNAVRYYCMVVVLRLFDQSLWCIVRIERKVMNMCILKCLLPLL